MHLILLPTQSYEHLLLRLDSLQNITGCLQHLLPSSGKTKPRGKQSNLTWQQTCEWDGFRHKIMENNFVAIENSMNGFPSNENRLFDILSHICIFMYICILMYIYKHKYTYQNGYVCQLLQGETNTGLSHKYPQFSNNVVMCFPNQKIQTHTTLWISPRVTKNCFTRLFLYIVDEKLSVHAAKYEKICKLLYEQGSQHYSGAEQGNMRI